MPVSCSRLSVLHVLILCAASTSVCCLHPDPTSVCFLPSVSPTCFYSTLCFLPFFCSHFYVLLVSCYHFCVLPVSCTHLCVIIVSYVQLCVITVSCAQLCVLPFSCSFVRFVPSSVCSLLLLPVLSDAVPVLPVSVSLPVPLCVIPCYLMSVLSADIHNLLMSSQCWVD